MLNLSKNFPKKQLFKIDFKIFGTRMDLLHEVLIPNGPKGPLEKLHLSAKKARFSMRSIFKFSGKIWKSKYFWQLKSNVLNSKFVFSGRSETLEGYSIQSKLFSLKNILKVENKHENKWMNTYQVEFLHVLFCNVS